MELKDVKGVLPTRCNVSLEPEFGRGYNQCRDEIGNLDCFTLLEKLLDAGCADMSICETCGGKQLIPEPAGAKYLGKPTLIDCPDCRNGVIVKRKD